jgi:hypothetical protein
MKVTNHIEDAKGETLFSFEIIPPQKGKASRTCMTILIDKPFM